VFTGWSGACNGTAPTCSTTVNDQVTATAAFSTLFTLSIGRSNPGTVVGNPAGSLGTSINCGSACSAKFTDGTAVTLTALPPAGKQFVNWSGACAGTAPTCTVTISKSTSVNAVFSK
jgi:hypothetical protein